MKMLRFDRLANFWQFLIWYARAQKVQNIRKYSLKTLATVNKYDTRKQNVAGCGLVRAISFQLARDYGALELELEDDMVCGDL